MNRQKSNLASSIVYVSKVMIAFVSLLMAASFAQNPVPQIVGPVKPMAVTPGSGAFTLTIYGANFVSGAVVNWNGQPRSTVFVSARELQAQILATDVATNTAGLISVTNPAPGGGNSSASWAQVEVHAPVTTFSFGQPRTYGFGGWLVLPADYTSSGILGLIGQSGDDLVLYDGNGKGAFQFQSIAGHFYDGAHGGVFGDFNGDGNLDLAYVAGYEGLPSSQMNVVLGDGKGQFSLGSQIKGHIPLYYVAAGDFNGDGKLDLIVASGLSFHVYLGNGDGSFTRFKDYHYETLDMVLGDFNGDGKLDMATVSSLSSAGFVINVSYGKGDGTFQTPQTVASFSGSGVCGFQNYLQATDFNSDGNLDLAVCTDSQVGVVLNNGDGTFEPPVFVTAGTLSEFTFAVGDINSDGKTDLLVSQINNSHPFAIFLGNGDGTFQPPQTMNLPQAELGIFVADFNSDGLPDFIIEDGGVLLYLQ